MICVYVWFMCVADVCVYMSLGYVWGWECICIFGECVYLECVTHVSIHVYLECVFSGKRLVASLQGNQGHYNHFVLTIKCLCLEGFFSWISQFLNSGILQSPVLASINSAPRIILGATVDRMDRGLIIGVQTFTASLFSVQCCTRVFVVP